MKKLNFVVNDQFLKKGVGFPEFVVERSKNYLILSFDNIPDGYSNWVYFRLSWDVDNVYKRPITNGICYVHEKCLTLPENATDYVDYIMSVSVAGENSDLERFTTNAVDIVVKQSNYSDNAIQL